MRGGRVKVLCVELGRGVCGMVRGAVCGGGGGRRGRFQGVVSEGGPKVSHRALWIKLGGVKFEMTTAVSVKIRVWRAGGGSLMEIGGDGRVVECVGGK